MNRHRWEMLGVAGALVAAGPVLAAAAVVGIVIVEYVFGDD